ncbi:hypothetical protein MBM_06488 [Drepanopeziza brunnea f. sp. 'multigermtubi' MB_m1]|uniref:Uncharacterized protein n=1 Tax=Marssonina brunnea f. sp. multigermtubi (strain MB_m1) TaxID=1072389 RepID=K1WSB5_MARBU|nr:uncharacterized protein MBM_06488 [Drepanopeziza brunnea f. sp. 'multigermtubi' MB_m1]EKD15272.1 hypothetical protein MBM_06488 [Drepanopeziza brunnea f. sp. 'multigermtubi' MB_m1]
MHSRSEANLGTQGEASNSRQILFQRSIKPSLSNPQSTIRSKAPTHGPPGSLSFTHSSPPYDPDFPQSPAAAPRPRPVIPRTNSSRFYDPFSSPSKPPPPLRRISFPALTCSSSNLTRKSSLPSRRKPSLSSTSTSLSRPRPHLLSRLASSISSIGSKIFTTKKSPERGRYGGDAGEPEEELEVDEELSSLHLELPTSISRDRSEIDYLRRMEREAIAAQKAQRLRRTKDMKRTYATPSRRTSAIPKSTLIGKSSNKSFDAGRGVEEGGRANVPGGGISSELKGRGLRV